MWTTIISFVLGLAGKIFGIGQPTDPNKAERDTGEALGKAETGQTNAIAGLKELDTANKARDDLAGKFDADPSLQRAPDDHMGTRDPSTGIS